MTSSTLKHAHTHTFKSSQLVSTANESQATETQKSRCLCGQYKAVCRSLYSEPNLLHKNIARQPNLSPKNDS